MIKQKQTHQHSLNTKDYSKDDQSMQFLPLIQSFFYGAITLSYTVTLYPFVRLFQWWFSIVKYLLFEIPRMITKKSSQYVMRYQWLGNLVLPIVKLIFVDLLRIPDKDVSNYLRIDVSRLRDTAQDDKGKNVVENITQRVTPVVRKVSDKVSSSIEKFIPQQSLNKKEQPIVEQPSTNKDQLDKLEKQIETLNLVISKQKSKIDKLKQNQEHKVKVDVEKLESLRKEKDTLVHEKNRLEHTTLTQLQMMQEVQVMLNNQAKKIHEFESFKENLSGQVHTLQNENEVLKSEVLKEREKGKKFNSEVDRWNNLKENLEDQLVLINRQLQMVNEENLKLKERNFNLEKGLKENSQRSDAFEKVKHDFHDISIKLTQKEDELHNLNDKIKEKSKENELLKTQVGDLDLELKKLSLDYSILKKQSSQKAPQKPTESIPKKEDQIKQERDKVGVSKKKTTYKEIPADAETQEEAIKEMESDRIKETPVVEKNVPFNDKNLKKEKNVKETKVSDKIESKHVEDVSHEKDTYLTPSWEEETLIESNKPLSRRKSQQQLKKEGEEADIYQVSDNYVEELNYMLDDIEKGEIENVQFQSIISNPKINGSLSKLDPEQVDDLLDVLENSDNVSFVDFSDCGMDNSLTQKILHSLSKNNSIEVVDLATNCVEPNSLVENLIEFIENNHKCNKLLMKDWKFSDENLNKIIQSIQSKNKSLVDLKLDTSDNSEENLKMLHQAIQNNILVK